MAHTISYSRSCRVEYCEQVSVVVNPSDNPLAHRPQTSSPKHVYWLLITSTSTRLVGPCSEDPLWKSTFSSRAPFQTTNHAEDDATSNQICLKISPVWKRFYVLFRSDQMVLLLPIKCTLRHFRPIKLRLKKRLASSLSILSWYIIDSMHQRQRLLTVKALWCELGVDILWVSHGGYRERSKRATQISSHKKQRRPLDFKCNLA